MDRRNFLTGGVALATVAGTIGTEAEAQAQPPEQKTFVVKRVSASGGEVRGVWVTQQEPEIIGDIVIIREKAGTSRYISLSNGAYDLEVDAAK